MAPLLSPQSWLLIVAAGLIVTMNFHFRRAERYPTVLFLSVILFLSVPGFLLLRRMLDLPVTVSPWPDLAFGWSACLIGLVSTARAYIRYGPRICTACGTRLRLLSEAQEDEQLEYGRQLEERLGVVNYDVWVCSTCAPANLESYANFLRGRRPCPRCGYRTLGRQDTDSGELCEYCKGRPPRIVIPPPPPPSVSIPPPAPPPPPPMPS